MSIVCNNTFAYHYWGNNILIYKTLHEFVSLPQLHTDIVDLIANYDLDYESLYNALCSKYSVDTEDAQIHQAYVKVISKLMAAGYIFENKTHNKKKITGTKGLFYPFSIVVEITDKCNLRCKHCYRDTKQQNFREMNMDEFRDLCKTFKGKTPNLILTGGEITTNSDIVDMIGIASTDFCLYILSNGIALSNIPLSTIRKIKFAQLSVYGFDDDSFYNFTNVHNGLLGFEKGVQLIQKANNDYLITLMITRSNKSIIEKYITYLIKLKVKRIAFGINSPIGKICKDNKNMFLTNSEREEVVNTIKNLENKYSHQILFMPYSSIASLEFSTKSQPYSKGDFSCSAGKTNVIIDPYGNVRPCHMMPTSLFNEYNFRKYGKDLENCISPNYKSEIVAFGKYLEANSHSYKDMNCVGFCNL